MYKVYAGSFCLYADNIDFLKISNTKLVAEVNKTGSFKFTIYPDHPHYGLIEKLKTIVTVYQDDYILFRGRVLSDGMGFHNEKNIECEGELAFLLDSIVRPYEYSGSVRGFLEDLVNSHNSQVDAVHRFVLGNVTVTDPNDYIVRSSIDYESTWKVIQDKLIKLLGGYIWTRHENGMVYLDYVEDFTLLSSQKIEFAKNLLDMKRVRNGKDIITALVPLGAKLEDENGERTGERLTIKAVNGGVDYIYDASAVVQYGWIFGKNVWDDVTQPQNLLSKGNTYLAEKLSAPETINLSAADLAPIDRTVTSFHIGTYVRVISGPHGVDQPLLVTKLTIDLLNPAKNKLSLGGTVRPFTESMTSIDLSQLQGITGPPGPQGPAGKDAAVISETEPSDKTSMWLDISRQPPVLRRWNDINWEIVNDTSQLSQAIELLSRDVSSSISQSSEQILQTISDRYYLKGETDALIKNVSTSLSQTSDAFEMRFNDFQADLNDVISNTDIRFRDITKYIRFVDGKIILGQEGSNISVQISNTEIGFYDETNTKIAYISNKKLVITSGEFLDTLYLGRFGFEPRAAGNLTFKRKY